MLFSCSPKEAFPLLRRLLYDSFQVDAWIFSWPYQDLDRIDNSIRRTLWGEYFHTPVEFQDFWENFPSHNIIILKSSLGFCNIICLLSSESHPDFISIGPFREHEMTPSFLSRTARENHLSGKSFPLMQNFYRTMPMADPESLASFLSHFLGALLPDYDKVPPVHVSFSETVRKIISDHELLLSENADHAERYADRYRQTIDALVSGDLDTALHALRSWLSLSVLPEESHTGQFRRYLTVINEKLTAIDASYAIPTVGEFVPGQGVVTPALWTSTMVESFSYYGMTEYNGGVMMYNLESSSAVGTSCTEQHDARYVLAF